MPAKTTRADAARGAWPILLACLCLGACVDLSKPTRLTECEGQAACASGDAGQTSVRTGQGDGPVDAPQAAAEMPEVGAKLDAASSTIPGPPTGATQLGNSVPCGLASQCASGFCVDGVCCQSACAQACYACNLPGWAGNCVPIPSGEDPNNDCPSDDPATCKRDGLCNGAGDCRLYGTGTTCQAATCTGSVQSPARACDGLGTCRPANNRSCDPYVCAGAVCGTSCATKTDCVATSGCENKKCTGRLPSGSPCANASECSSNFCIDGVCCQTACTQTCYVCNLPDSRGSCEPIAAGQDPSNECALDVGSPCGKDGTCDGRGSCRLNTAGTVCAPATCTGETETSPRTCDGLGLCRPAFKNSCAPYACAPSATACLAKCTSNAGCATASICSNGTCAPKKAPASLCASATECASGFCEQGVCCATACTGLCRSCAAVGMAGTCAPVPKGQDPLNQCADMGANSCSTDGTCDGAGACQVYAAGTQCAPPSCAAGMRTPPRTCNGTGVCRAVTPISCTPYDCDGMSCRLPCTKDQDCPAPSTCGNGLCVGKPIAAACVTGAECASGICAQGVCCGSPCSSTCQVCNLTGSVGTCTNVPAGDDPLIQCADNGVASCGTDGSCNGAGACRTYPVGTICVGASCIGSSFTPPRTCGPSNTCQAAVMSVSCGAYVCGNAGACKSSCTSNADCDSPSVCNAGACGGLRGEYYDNIDFTGTKVTRTDPVVDFDWGTGSPDPALDVDSFSVRWTGKVTPLYSETYTFYTSADDGTILWVNGIEIVDNWSDHPESESAGTITLTANRPYDIRLDYYDHFSDAAAHLLWSSPSQAKQIIPASQLRP